MSIATNEMMLGQIQYYLDEMDLFATMDDFSEDETLNLESQQQSLKVCSLSETDFERYKKWKELDQKARRANEKELEKLMPEMFEIVDLNGDGELDRCELAKECYGAWGLSKKECVTYAMDQFPLE